MRRYLFCAVLLSLSMGMVAPQAGALGTFTCSSPCVNGDSQVGQGTGTSDTLTIASAVTGHPILVFTRGGINSDAVSVGNDSGPGTLSWVHLTDLSPAFASDWVYDVHCAMVPTNGTYTFHTTNNSGGGTPSSRVWAMQLDAGTCTGALTNIKTQAGDSTPDSNSITIASGTYVVVSGAASDGDWDTAQGGTTRTLTGGTIVNNDCNSSLEPDQKGCIAVWGLKTAGSYTATWSVGTDIWTVAVIALPIGGGEATFGMRRFSPMINLHRN